MSFPILWNKNCLQNIKTSFWNFDDVIRFETGKGRFKQLFVIPLRCSALQYILFRETMPSQKFLVLELLVDNQLSQAKIKFNIKLVLAEKFIKVAI